MIQPQQIKTTTVTGEMLADIPFLEAVTESVFDSCRVTATLNPLKEGDEVYTWTLNIEEL